MLGDEICPAAGAGRCPPRSAAKPGGPLSAGQELRPPQGQAPSPSACGLPSDFPGACRGDQEEPRPAPLCAALKSFGFCQLCKTPALASVPGDQRRAAPPPRTARHAPRPRSARVLGVGLRGEGARAHACAHRAPRLSVARWPAPPPRGDPENCSPEFAFFSSPIQLP